MSDDSLFREVDEEVRQEQYKKLWERYGNVLIALAALVVIGVAGFKGWQFWQLKQSQAAGQAYFDALKTVNGDKPLEGVSQLQHIDHAGYRPLAAIRAAAALAANDQPDQAVKAFEAVAADASVDPTLRDLAEIRAGYVLANSLTADELKTRLAKFDVDGNPWRNEMREIVGLAAWHNQNFALADQMMNAIVADPAAGPGLRQRAAMLLELVAPLLPKS